MLKTTHRYKWIYKSRPRAPTFTTAMRVVMLIGSLLRFLTSLVSLLARSTI